MVFPFVPKAPCEIVFGVQKIAYSSSSVNWEGKEEHINLSINLDNSDSQLQRSKGEKSSQLDEGRRD